MLRSFRRTRVRVNDPGPGEAVLATDLRFCGIPTENTWPYTVRLASVRNFSWRKSVHVRRVVYNCLGKRLQIGAQ